MILQAFSTLFHYNTQIFEFCGTGVIMIVINYLLECPPREHQGEGLPSVFQTFAENPFLYPGMIVNAIVYVRRRWCVC